MKRVRLNPVTLRAAHASVGGERMEWSDGEFTVFDDTFETVYTNEVLHETKSHHTLRFN